MWMKFLPLLKKLFEYLLPFIQKKVEAVIEAPAVVNTTPVEQPQICKPEEIDWNDPKSKINKRFSVKEATYLPSWGVSHIPNAEQKKNIIDVAIKIDQLMDKLEVELDKKLTIDVHVFIRPGVVSCPGTKWDGQDYNAWLYQHVVWKDLSEQEKAKKTVPNSPHKKGNAVDFHIIGYEGKDGCAKIRDLIEPRLKEFGLRMEDLVGTWVHLDSNAPGINPDGSERRKFKP